MHLDIRYRPDADKPPFAIIDGNRIIYRCESRTAARRKLKEWRQRALALWYLDLYGFGYRIPAC